LIQVDETVAHVKEKDELDFWQAVFLGTGNLRTDYFASGVVCADANSFEKCRVAVHGDHKRVVIAICWGRAMGYRPEFCLHIAARLHGSTKLGYASRENHLWVKVRVAWPAVSELSSFPGFSELSQFPISESSCSIAPTIGIRSVDALNPGGPLISAHAMPGLLTFERLMLYLAELAGAVWGMGS
jgi:hypothetical protein